MSSWGHAVIILLAAAILIAAAVYLAFKIELDAARARVSASQTVQTSFGVMEYAVIGTGEPVLVVHWLCGRIGSGA
jgi:hypothetical protein